MRTVWLEQGDDGELLYFCLPWLVDSSLSFAFKRKKKAFWNGNGKSSPSFLKPSPPISWLTPLLAASLRQHPILHYCSLPEVTPVSLIFISSLLHWLPGPSTGCDVVPSMSICLDCSPDLSLGHEPLLSSQGYFQTGDLQQPHTYTRTKSIIGL